MRVGAGRRRIAQEAAPSRASPARSARTPSSPPFSPGGRRESYWTALSIIATVLAEGDASDRREDSPMATTAVSSSDPVSGEGQSAHADAPDLRFFVYGLFFVFGGITSLNDVIIPKLKALFTLSYGEVMLVQSAFFAAYFIISIPAASLVRRIGYMRSAVAGLLTMTAGCLLFIPASSYGLFGLFLLALFVLAAGITTVQVVANPLISMLGPARTASSRLTFAQAFNSLGTTLFPYVGSILILGSLATVDPKTLSEA